MTLKYADYDSYLRSDVWKAKRKLALERAHNRCQLCNSDKKLEVHHRHYSEWGKEPVEDLTVLCRHCHRKFTKWDRKNKQGEKTHAYDKQVKQHKTPLAFRVKKLTYAEIKAGAIRAKAVRGLERQLEKNRLAMQGASWRGEDVRIYLVAHQDLMKRKKAILER